MAQITANRPLPRRTCVNYDEYYAKFVLELYFPNKYKDLVVADKPDLRTADGLVGIEVTTATPYETQEMISLARKIPLLDEKAKKKIIEGFTKKGCQYDKSGLGYPSQRYKKAGTENPKIENAFYNEFISAVHKKLTKLNNSNYITLSRYDLFVQADFLDIEECMPQKIMKRLVEMSNQPINFTFIYLLASDGLYVFDTSEHKHFYYEVMTVKLSELSIKARNLCDKR